MKPLEFCIMLVVHICVTAGKRRGVQFMNCPLAKAKTDFMTIEPVRSRIECSVICLNHPHCLSASFCKTTDGYMCHLSAAYTDGSCNGHVVDGGCSQTNIVHPCENGGTFFPENRTCHCADGFIGDYCQRRYRDCLETPRKNVMYTIQPFGTDFTFQWKCGPGVNYTSVSQFGYINVYNYTASWEQMKQGIPQRIGYHFTGLEPLHQLTKQGVYDLFVWMHVIGKARGYVIYKNFSVSSESEGYACSWDHFARDNSAYYSSDQYLDGLGALGDSTKSMQGAHFGTVDSDINGCASAYNFPWWYNPSGCTFVTFNQRGLNWPTNRNGTVEIENIDVTIIGLKNMYWFVEDDLVL